MKRPLLNAINEGRDNFAPMTELNSRLFIATKKLQASKSPISMCHAGITRDWPNLLELPPAQNGRRSSTFDLAASISQNN